MRQFVTSSVGFKVYFAHYNCNMIWCVWRGLLGISVSLHVYCLISLLTLLLLGNFPYGLEKKSFLFTFETILISSIWACVNHIFWKWLQMPCIRPWSSHWLARCVMLAQRQNCSQSENRKWPPANSALFQTTRSLDNTWYMSCNHLGWLWGSWHVTEHHCI